MTLRLFVAVALDDATRAACAAAAQALQRHGWAGRFVAPENYHCTVAFLGAVGEERAGTVLAAMREAVPSVPPFAFTLDAVGAFPDPGRPRVAWIGPAQPVPAFGTLCGVVRSALVAHGFSFDPHADAHVTLARSDGRRPLPAVTAPHAPPLTVDAVTLYASHSQPDGPRYDPLGRVALSGAGTMIT